jgi:hypothetical protein
MMEITHADRDERGRIMAEAERRAADRNMSPAAPAPAGEEPARPRPVRAISPSQRLVLPARIRPQLSPRVHAQLIGAALAIAAMIAVAMLALGRSAGMSAAPPPRPTAAPARPTAPAPAIVPTAVPTATPVPPTATPEPPTQTPAIVYVEQPPCYSVTEDVYDGSRPLGTVTGTSCDSQAAAQANADALAAQMKEGR